MIILCINAFRVTGYNASRKFVQRTCQTLLVPSNPTLLPHPHRRLLTTFPKAEFYKRTHTCGELRLDDKGKGIKLCGWVSSVRQLSDELCFITLRDSYGTTQVVLKGNIVGREVISQLRKETVISIDGIVAERPQEMKNDNVSTGEIEIDASFCRVLNKTSDPLPFYPSDRTLASEDVRARYRYLDLRTDVLQSNIRLRSRIALEIRKYLDQQGFIDVETPLLFKSTPEGAREFLVPTRSKGSFYALPQSPQQLKQMLMVGGIDKYYQIARCFRDEDLRADRQPEFTQVDLEMSFVTMEDVMQLCENLIKHIFVNVTAQRFDEPFPQMKYEDAMRRFGSDKPDTRFSLELNALPAKDNSKVVQCLILPMAQGLPNREISRITKQIQQDYKQKIYTIKINDGNISNFAEKFPIVDGSWTSSSLQVKPGDRLFMAETQFPYCGGSTIMGQLRLTLSQILSQNKLLEVPRNKHAFLWIHSFPLFTRNTESGLWTSTHHPFTSPVEDHLDLLESNPENVIAEHYDLVLNGMEIGGGSIRVHEADLQLKIMRHVLRLSESHVSTFDHLIQALRSGCPPHGGFAFGFDRLMAILCNAASIRDVIAFPKAASGRDPVVGSPTHVSDGALTEYGLKLA